MSKDDDKTKTKVLVMFARLGHTVDPNEQNHGGNFWLYRRCVVCNWCIYNWTQSGMPNCTEAKKK